MNAQRQAERIETGAEISAGRGNAYGGQHSIARVDLLAAAARFVRRHDDFQRAISFFARDQRLATGLAWLRRNRRNWRSNGSSEIAIGSDAPEATSFASGAGSPLSFSTSHVVSLSPVMTAVPFVP